MPSGGRRGYKDEFFYSGTSILEDRGLATASGSPGSYPIDEYVWLDGRPVVLIKSQFDSGWSRQQDSQGTCTRNSEEAPCGIYFPVTDYLGKPVLLVDSDRRVAGVGDYDPFGHVNRVTYLGDTPHPYGSASERVLGFFSQKPTSTTSVKLRARYAYVDTNSGTYTYLSDQWGAELAGARSEGAHLGRAVTPWVQVPSDGRVHVRFHKGASDLGTRYGAILEGYDYRRYETGASPVWLPLRFPGQYHDAETDLFENWNRFYDPSLGRYLAPDPILLAPAKFAKSAAMGLTPLVYAYAGDNPIAFTDPNGLLVNTNDVVIGYYIMQILGSPGFGTDVGGGLARMIMDPKNVYNVAQVDPATMGRGWSGGSTTKVGTENGVTTWDIKLSLEKANENRTASGWRPEAMGGLLAHELGHAYSKAYKSQAWGVEVPGGVIWQHEKTAIDWENATMPGEPRRPYLAPGGHSYPICEPYQECEPPVPGVYGPPK